MIDQSPDADLFNVNETIIKRFDHDRYKIIRNTNTYSIPCFHTQIERSKV